MFGGKADDQLPERGRLGQEAEARVRSGEVTLLSGFRLSAVAPTEGGVMLVDESGKDAGPFDKIVNATGFRPELGFLREVRVDLDPMLESSRALAPLIDPNVHSCGSVPPHGAAELAHPEANLYIVGAKSYGRAPTFLLATGYEQVRSVVAAIAGDKEGAADVQLVLPETGVCSLPKTAAPDVGDLTRQSESAQAELVTHPPAATDATGGARGASSGHPITPRRSHKPSSSR